MHTTLLQIKNLGKTYRSKRSSVEALGNVSFDLQKGEIFALLGVNGAGKTTLSSIIASLYPPTHGDVLWKGKSIYKDLIAFRKIIGFCPQYQNLDHDLTLQENLDFQGRYYGMTKKEAKARTQELLSRFNMGQYASASVSMLSGGYKQRFLFARAMVHSPELIILDEPTVGLDPHVRRKLWKFILELKEAGVSVLLTTHYLDEAEILADRVCVMDNGQIKIIDSPSNLKKDLQKKNLEEVFLHLLKEGAVI